MKKSVYMDRALKSRDPRFAKILGKLGYDTRVMTSNDTDTVLVDEITSSIPASDTSNDDDHVEQLRDARSKYENVFGKKPFYGWDRATLLDKIEKAKE